jgi:hypothetical protein
MHRMIHGGRTNGLCVGSDEEWTHESCGSAASSIYSFYKLLYLLFIKLVEPTPCPGSPVVIFEFQLANCFHYTWTLADSNNIAEKQGMGLASRWTRNEAGR